VHRPGQTPELADRAQSLHPGIKTVFAIEHRL
jgi:hypothetical protein